MWRYVTGTEAAVPEWNNLGLTFKMKHQVNCADVIITFSIIIWKQQLSQIAEYIICKLLQIGKIRLKFKINWTPLNESL